MNAYEIRNNILELATGLEQSRYEKDYQVWEQSQEREPESGRLVYDQTNPAPNFPSSKEILDLAQELYAFVEHG